MTPAARVGLIVLLAAYGLIILRSPDQFRLIDNVDLAIQVPSWNAAYRIANNRVYKTAECKAFEEVVGWAYNGECHEGEVQVFIEFHRSPLIDAAPKQRIRNSSEQPSG